MKKTIVKTKAKANNDKNECIYGYHLGSDLFSMFINDTMDNCVILISKLINIMANKKESPFTISVGLSQCPNNTSTTIGTTTTTSKKSFILRQFQKSTEKKEIARQIEQNWVTNGKINLLRAKEGGKNQYISDEVSLRLLF